MIKFLLSWLLLFSVVGCGLPGSKTGLNQSYRMDGAWGVLSNANDYQSLTIEGKKLIISSGSGSLTTDLVTADLNNKVGGKSWFTTVINVNAAGKNRMDLDNFVVVNKLGTPINLTIKVAEASNSHDIIIEPGQRYRIGLKVNTGTVTFTITNFSLS